MTTEPATGERGGDADVIQRMAKAMATAVIRDDEGEFPRMFDLLDYSGENRCWTIARGLARAALAAAKGPEWIRCSERMPEVGAHVLVYGKDYRGRPTATYVERPCQYMDGPGVDRHWSCSAGTHHVDCVTAWMPLPEGPKG